MTELITMRFNAAMNESWGTLGWIPENAPSTYYPIGGMGVAHDVLEHAPGDTGTPQEELQAFGAMLLVRGEGGYWHQYSPSIYKEPSEQIHTELVEVVGMEFRGIQDGVGVPPRRRKPLPDQVREWIGETKKLARQVALRKNDDYSDELWTPTQLRSFLDRVPGWMTQGYLLAEARFAGHPPHDLAACFHYIERRADEELKHAEVGIGQQLHVRVLAVPYLHAEVTLIEPEYPEDEEEETDDEE